MTKSEAVAVSETVDIELGATDLEIGAAFDRIVDAASRMMDLTDDLPVEVSGKLEQALGEILEASAARDIAGQRIRSARAAVQALATGGPIEADPDDALLNGPATGDGVPDQDEIDRLFDEAD
jgi:hypothetical protein